MENLKIYLTFFLSFLIVFISHGQVEIDDLTTEYQETPLGLDVENPRFSWKMINKSSERGLYQKNYQIIVKNEQSNVVWSTKIESDKSLNIIYKGDDLQPETRYSWEVMVEDNKGNISKASSWFETGLMNSSPDLTSWDGAQWIGGTAKDIPLYAQALSVFKASYDIRFNKKNTSNKAGFIFGANVQRLMNKNLNIFEVENKLNESYLYFELDISPLDKGESALFNIYRKGYTQEEKEESLIYSFTIPKALINTSNQYEWHQVYFEMNFGKCLIFINGKNTENQINSKDEPDWVDVKGVSLNPLVDAGGDLIVYPVLADIGFKVPKNQEVEFSNVAIYNYREPSNFLFKEDLEASTNSIFKSKRLKTSNKAYTIKSKKEAVLITANPSKNAIPMLRTEFTSNKAIKKARLYATARGIYELYLNGKKINDNYFAPGLTQYNKVHMYQIYDVTPFINSDKNTLGAILGEGWWSGSISYRGFNWNYFGDRQSLLSKLVITYKDNTSETIVSNSKDWKIFTDGPISYSSFFQGEYYDANKENAVEGWLKSNYNDDHWQNTSVVPLNNETAYIGKELNYEDQEIIAQIGDSPNIVKELKPISVNEVKPGVFIYDMGQNMVGFPKIELKNTTADTIRLRYAEMLYPDLPEYSSKKGTLMLENIRGALTTDQYILGDNKSITIQPKFTFHGFRYLEITGIKKAIPLQNITGLVVSSIDSLSSNYTTSNPKINKLWENITWSFRSNFLSIPTDTPARNERMGWNGDINVFSETATYLGDVDLFLKRHLIANRNLQTEDGRFPDIAPIGTGFGGTLWGSAGVTIPWTLYNQYGDQRILEEHYDAMKSYVEYLASKQNEEEVLLEGPLGDWLSPEGYKNDNTQLWTAYQLKCLAILLKTAEVLEKPADLKFYQEKYDQRLKFFMNTYFNPEGKTIHTGINSGSFAPQPKNFKMQEENDLIDSQASYAIPLNFELLSNSSLVAEHLVETVKRENKDHLEKIRPAKSLMTGFIGTAALLPALSKNGYDALAYEVLQQTSYPSWLYSVENGATTIWERLNSYTKDEGFGGNNSMNSFNHYSFGAVGSWMYAYSLGIQPLAPGYKKILLTPRPDPTGKMKWASGYYDSSYGRIESEWKVEGDKTVYHFIIPPNTKAEVKISCDQKDKIEFLNFTEDNIESIEKEEGFQVLQLLSGEYEITVTKS